MIKTNYSIERSNLLIFFSIICFLLFVLLALLVHAGMFAVLDEKILLVFRHNDKMQTPLGRSWLLPLMRGITALGNIPAIIAVAAVISYLLIINKEFKLMLVVLIVILGSSLLDVFLKDIFARSRPEIVSHLVDAQSFGFPSGHSLMSAIIYPTLAITLFKIIKDMKVKIYIFSAAVFLAIIIGLSRIYLGVHYPTDVFAGWLIGFSCTSLLWILIIRYYKQQKIMRTDERR